MIVESQTINDVLVVNLNGDLDAFTIQEVNKRLTQFIGEDYRKIVVNFSKVCYINSMSISVIDSRLQELKARRGELVLVELSDRVNRILTLMGGKKFFKIFKTEKEAVVVMQSL